MVDTGNIGLSVWPSGCNSKGMTTTPKTTPTLIEVVVNPLKTDAMDRAEQYARVVIADVTKELATAGNDLEICAPYPSSMNITRGAFMAKESKYRLFRKLTTSRRSTRSMHEPNFADMNPKAEAEFVKEAREDAAFQYEAFVAKLNKKVGEVVHAKLEGNHVWGFSFLHVELPTGEKQIWKTQQILNQSKLGKVFNQFPTRKVKVAK